MNNGVSSVVLVCASLTASAQGRVVTKAVEYRHGDVVLEGLLAYDDAYADKQPGVLVIHEWWGCNDYAKRRATMLAELGYVAFALDLYGKGVVTDKAEEAGKLAGQFRDDPKLLRARAAAGLDVLARDERVDPQRIAAIGYCFGGSTCLHLAYSGADLKGVVSFHGNPPAPDAHDAGRVKARLLVLHGADDPLVPQEQIDGFIEAARRARLDWQLVSYGGAVHSFTNPNADKVGIDGVRYNASADRRSWEHMKLFFVEIFGERTGGRPPTE